MSAKPETLAILRATRERLANIENWCSDGPAKGNQECIFVAIGNTTQRMFGTGPDGLVSNITGGEDDMLLFKAANEIIKGSAPSRSLLNLNDGKHEWAEVPAEERHKLVLKVIDRAIELGEKA